eukprot:818178-Alexandrium_andersonii.AAC.1
MSGKKDRTPCAGMLPQCRQSQGSSTTTLQNKCSGGIFKTRVFKSSGFTWSLPLRPREVLAPPSP